MVGALDLRIKAAKAPSRKAMGPTGIPAEMFGFAAEELTRIWDLAVVEFTLSVNVPIQFQGGDNAMLVKAANKSAQDLSNLSEILLANQEPKILGSVMRDRFASSLQGHITESQYGEGFGGFCEIAHLTTAASPTKE